MKKIVKYLIFLIFVILVLGITRMVKAEESKSNTETTSQTEVIQTDIINTLSSLSYITSGLEEKKELHTTYFFDEIYFEKNQVISSGENIVKYTNGEYFAAPYDCILAEAFLPNQGEVCTKQHYLQLQAINPLTVQVEIEETKLNTIYIGQEARIQMEALDNKTVTGYVTKIDSTANYSTSGSTFGVTVSFANDGEILLGMSAKCEIILEKAENVMAVAIEAVKESKGKKYVTKQTAQGQSQEIEIETGIENDAYVEVKSGLAVGDIVLLEENETNNKQNRMTPKGQREEKQGEFPSNGKEGMPMPASSQEQEMPKARQNEK